MYSYILLIRQHIMAGNTVWFLIPGIIFVLLLVFTLLKKKDMKLVVLYFSMSAIAGFLEIVIFFLFESYEYYPQVWNDWYYDNTFGAYLSQRFFVSSVAIFVAAFNLGFGFILLFIAMFVGIEYAFLALKVYKLNWWHPTYTAIGLLIYFYIGKVWYRCLLDGSYRFFRMFTLGCFAFTLYTDVIAIPTLSGHYEFAVDWFDNPSRDTVIVILIYCLTRGYLIAFVCCYKRHWVYLSFLTAAIWLSYIVLIQFDIFIYKHLWDLWLFAASDLIVLFSSLYFNRVLSRPDK
ncbi:hypothetical protein [Alkalihalobacillus sp. TS-13]|uniref:hypothetical protein n=1 Tax=Alkalihalobacillus sp. TS-13 TaxID=2842455 RepID=UPI001C87BE47|nr:hypothetical protein [Alkalihalobacillus sp. TS-13]